MAQAIDVDRSNIRNWENGKGMTARSLLLYLAAVGAKISPSEPELAPGAVNAEVRDLRQSLQSVAEEVARIGPILTELADRVETLGHQAADEGSTRKARRR